MHQRVTLYFYKVLTLYLAEIFLRGIFQSHHGIFQALLPLNYIY